MKLISLNVWGANQGQLFFDFIGNQVTSTDIFCFQEVLSASQPAPKVTLGAHCYLFDELKQQLPGYRAFFCERKQGINLDGQKVDFPLTNGLAIFIKDGIEILAEQKILVMNEIPEDHPSEGDFMVQILQLEISGKNLFVLNYHGMSVPGDKLDTPRRLEASQNLVKIWNNLGTGAKILCGDFNLNPNTQSINLFSEAAKNLIAEFKVINTRNEVSWKKFSDRQFFADYTFTTDDLKIKTFEVPYNLASDHLPMILEFEL